MKRRILIALTVAALAATGVIAAVGIAAAGSGPSATVPVTGTAAGGLTFAGTMTVTGAAVQDGQNVALGTISGTLQDAAGNTVGSVTAVPVAATVAGDPCTLLSFSIGPIDINVIGIAVHIDPIGASVTLSGLLGNILCPLLGLTTTTTPA
jgi:hypothetical protein